MRLEEAADAVRDSETDLDASLRRANRRALARLVEESSEIQGEFEWLFDGLGVYDHSMTLARLNEVSGALGQTLRWTARDLVILEGRPVTTDLSALVEAVVSGTFHGSFGLRVSAPPVIEHPEMFQEGTLFERTADRVVAVFKATHEESPAVEVVALLSGLRRNAIAGFKNLAQTLAASNAPTVIRWRGDTVVPVSAADAELLFTTLDSVVPTEDELQVVGILEGGDRNTGQFHIVVPRVTGDQHYKGKTEEGVANELTGIELGARVVATLVILRLDSPFMQEPRETYLLRHISPAVTGG